MAGGNAAVLSSAQKALKDGDCQWALQHLDGLLNVENEVANAKQLKAEALRAHAVAQIICTKRHYYIQYAKELEQGDI